MLTLLACCLHSNGAGKSSIFRCLGGLWDIPTGRITKPGGESGLHTEVFYLPQKPYQVLGTLLDQITYPETGANRISTEELNEILQEFQLEYLLERPGVLVDEVNWEEELSLGEKQRLAMARLMYQKPNFAILDECTSAVSTIMERRLYDMVDRLNISFVTISHRPTLREFHDQVLAIGDGKQGFTLEKIPKSAAASPATVAARSAQQPSDAEIRAFSQSRSSKYEFKQNSTMKTSDTISQLKAVLKLGFTTRGYIVTRIVWVLGTVLVQMIVHDIELRMSGFMFGCAMARNKEGMVKAMLTLVGCNLLASWNQEIQIWHARHVQRHLMNTLTNNLMPRWTKANAFYRMNNIDARISDADHRIVNDVNSFADTVHTMLYHGGFIYPAVQVVWFTARLGLMIGWRIPAGLVAYNILSFLILKTCMPDYKKIVSDEQEAEGKFKFVHSRVKQHAESIVSIIIYLVGLRMHFSAPNLTLKLTLFFMMWQAFFGGGDREHEVIKSRFVAVMELDWARQWMDL